MGERKKVVLIFVICFIVLNLYITFSINKINSTKNDIVRFHVVASSNSLKDQLVKLKIASKLEEYINTLNIGGKTSLEILEEIADKKDEILAISNYILEEENLDYKTGILIGKIYYDTNKESPTLHMNKGSYNSVKIMLGNANGNNFWGIINPTKDNFDKIKHLNTIFPGINKIYDNDNTKSNVKYKSIIKEVLNL